MGHDSKGVHYVYFAPWHFFYRFVVAVRKNVLEYIIALVAAKN
jgi:hypothetical protein